MSRVSQHPSLSTNWSILVGGYNLLYENTVPVDMKYVDYDRNVNHLGSS